MTQVTSSEIVLLRSRPHNTKSYLSVYQPQINLYAQVNNPSAAKGDMFIPFDNVFIGNYSLVTPGNTLSVSDISGNDKGSVRVRYTSATGITVAENTYIDWADDDFITVEKFFEIQAVFPRIIQNPADETQTVWYKDYDIEYTNQNTLMGAFPNMGSHFAGFIEDDGYCQVYYTATGTSHVIDGTTLTYYWTFLGTASGTYTTTGLTPGYISYNTPGHYTSRLIVSGSNGSSDVSYRHISIYDRPGKGDNVPILDWSLDKISGSRDSGGYNVTIRIMQDFNNVIIREGSLIVIFSDNWYSGTKQSIGGNGINRDSIQFVGYVLDGTIRYNYKDHTIEFEVASPTGFMKISKGFSISLEDHDDPVGTSANDPGNYPSPWVLIPGMNVKKALYHYLRWHSTVLNCMDFQFLGTDQQIQYFDADRESLFNVIDTAMKGILVGHAVCDGQGKMWAETDAYIESKPINTFVLDNQDWMNEPTIDVTQVYTTSFIEIGGIYYSGVTGSSVPLLAGAPGSSPSYQGNVERIQGLALSSQAQLNTIGGNLYAHKNRKYPKITFDMAGNYGLFDIAPLERFLITIPAEFNPRGEEISDYFNVESLSWVYSPDKEVFIPNLNFTQVASGIPADTLEIPEIAPTDGETGGFNVPPFSIPPFEIPGMGGGDRFVSVPYIGERAGTTIYYGVASSPQIAGLDLDAGVDTITNVSCPIPNGVNTLDVYFHTYRSTVGAQGLWQAIISGFAIVEGTRADFGQQTVDVDEFGTYGATDSNHVILVASFDVGGYKVFSLNIERNGALDGMLSAVTLCSVMFEYR